MTCAICASELPPGALFCGECGSSVSALPRPAVADHRASDTSVISPTILVAEPGSAEDGGAPSDAGANARPGQTRIRPPEMPVAYLLRFSTGETAAISGSGLIGRNPVAQPGEDIPTLIPISDEERSVSKTHLEFGVSEGRMWVSDRFSANGSMRIEPGGGQRRLEPGRRYLIESGTRIAIGRQWVEFVLLEQIG